MSPRRVDRDAVRARMPGVEHWIIDELLDAFEPAALTAIAEAKPKTAVETSE